MTRSGLRWLVAASGVLLWLGGAVVFAEGRTARHLYRCRGRSFTGEFDNCFNDYLPVLEVFFVPALVLLLAYPFARFAFSLYAPAEEGRGGLWGLGTRAGGAGHWPVLQGFALVGLLWALWSWSGYPLDRPFLAFHLYWAAFAGWFTGAIIFGFVEARRSPDRC